MRMELLCAAVLGLAVLLHVLLRWRTHLRTPSGQRAALRRPVLLSVLSLAAAAMLYFTLFPPERSAPADALVLLTAQADQAGTLPAGRRIALPEAPTAFEAERVPDLATALRRYPGSAVLHVVGDGLIARDRDAAQGRSLRLHPSSAPIGVVELWRTPAVYAGMPWAVRGRIHGLPDAQVELLDPGNAVIARQRVDAQGGFALGDLGRAPGQVLYRVRVRDAKGAMHETLNVPVDVRQAPALRMLTLAGGPNAEVKLLRRWALDAGLQLQSRIDLGPGTALATPDAQINAATLRANDLLVLDERVWASMPAAEKRQVREAVAGGLGLLLRVTGPLDAASRADFAAFGLRIQDADAPQGVRLAEPGGKRELPELSRYPMQIGGAALQVALRDADGEALAVWRNVGEGRVGVLWLTDSHRLALAGFAGEHARLWSALASVLARPRPQQEPLLHGAEFRPHERLLACRLGDDAQVLAADGAVVRLLPDGEGAWRGCAAFWPRQSGWHTLASGDARLPFYVRAPDDGAALRRQTIRQATSALVSGHQRGGARASVPQPGSPWPFFIAWLCLSAVLWLLERSRFGVRAEPSALQG